MKLSVVVTTYNRPDALKKTLDGLFRQTRMPDEILVADDGSGRPTRDMLASYTGESPVPVRHVWQPDRGFRAARVRNLAISRAVGDYLVFLDGDCIPPAHFMEDQADLARPGCFFQGKRVLVRRGTEETFDHTTANSVRRCLPLALKNALSNRHHIVRIRWWPSVATTKLSGVRSCNMGVFRDDLYAVNGFNHAFEGWGREDSELAARLFKYGIKRRENPFRAVCFHLWHPENDRAGLKKNDSLLQQVLASPSHVCQAGLNELD